MKAVNEWKPDLETVENHLRTTQSLLDSLEHQYLIRHRKHVCNDKVREVLSLNTFNNNETGGAYSVITNYGTICDYISAVIERVAWAADTLDEMVDLKYSIIKNGGHAK